MVNRKKGWLLTDFLLNTNSNDNNLHNHITRSNKMYPSLLGIRTIGLNLIMFARNEFFTLLNCSRFSESEYCFESCPVRVYFNVKRKK